MGVKILCQNCGHENDIGCLFCRNCSEKLDMATMNPVEQLQKSKIIPIKNIAMFARRGAILLIAIFVLHTLYSIYMPTGTAALPVFDEARQKDIKARVQAIFSRGQSPAAPKVIQTPHGVVEVSKTPQANYRGRSKVLFSADEATYALNSVILEGTKMPAPFVLKIDFYGIPLIITTQSFHGVCDLRYTLRAKPEKNPDDPASTLGLTPMGKMVGSFGMESFTDWPVMDRIGLLAADEMVKNFLACVSNIEVKPMNEIQDDKELSKFDEGKTLEGSYAFVVTLKPPPAPTPLKK